MESVQIHTLSFSPSLSLSLPALIAEIFITLVFLHITQFYYQKFVLVRVNS